jgi:hypothetical protein
MIDVSDILTVFIIKTLVIEAVSTSETSVNYDLAMKIEVVETSETSVNFYETTRRSIPEDLFSYSIRNY